MTKRQQRSGRLARVLREGGFAITAETTPPLTADPAKVVARTAPLKGLVHAVNVTDGAGARAHLSSLAAAYFMAVENDLEAVLQFTTRDRNKLALERDLLGASAFGVPNILCLSGDPIDKGDEPTATAVNDIDSTGLVKLAAGLRDDGKLPSERAIEPPPDYLIGVADAPLDPPEGWAPKSLLGKLAAGADFAQTQFCFDTAVLARYLSRLAEHGVLEQLPILVGLCPLASARQGRWMRENLFGTIIPDAVIERLERAADPRAEGRRICAELMHELRELPGVAGCHLMGPGAEAQIAETIRESGLAR
jgi:methylenetetrahydrofolate reductase (NADPH)